MVRINHLVLIGDNGVLGLWLKSTISHSRLSQMSKILLLRGYSHETNLTKGQLVCKSMIISTRTKRRDKEKRRTDALAD